MFYYTYVGFFFKHEEPEKSHVKLSGYTYTI